jgi:hypothetical protein
VPVWPSEKTNCKSVARSTVDQPAFIQNTTPAASKADAARIANLQFSSPAAPILTGEKTRAWLIRGLLAVEIERRQRALSIVCFLAPPARLSGISATSSVGIDNELLRQGMLASRPVVSELSLAEKLLFRRNKSAA